jgi:peptidoglycan/xylan/chitin deacetylase (PgdA/CDA1 family)
MARVLVARGHLIGLHSHTHPTNMTLLPVEQQYAEYRRNFDYLSSLLGTSPQTMAHPSGSYNSDTLDILREMGVQIGFRSDSDSRFHTLLEMPRLDHMMVKTLQA